MPRYEQNGEYFWTIELAGSKITTSLGKVGNAGHARIKDHGTPQAAQSEYDRLVAEKVEQGYTLIGAAPTTKAKPASTKSASTTKSTAKPEAKLRTASRSKSRR